MSKKPKKGLQRLTELEQEITKILEQDVITADDTIHLSPEGKVRFAEMVNEKLNKMDRLNADIFYQTIEPILTDISRTQIWEFNHNCITSAIAALMQELGRMPSKSEIAKKAQLSRQTVYKHLKEYSTHPEYIEQIEQFRFMKAKVLNNVFKYAVNGDIRAARLYFEIVGGLNNKDNPNTQINTQNNYIQINGLIVSQETIKDLTPEQLSMIEGILKNTLSENLQV